MSRAAAFALACATAVHAAPFADPTRPPVVADDGNAMASTQGPRLESVLIAPDRRIAVISGQQVVVGARVGGSEVLRITESEVVLRGPQGEQTLKLVPENRRPATGKRGATP